MPWPPFSFSFCLFIMFFFSIPILHVPKLWQFLNLHIYKHHISKPVDSYSFCCFFVVVKPWEFLLQFFLNLYLVTDWKPGWWEIQKSKPSLGQPQTWSCAWYLPSPSAGTQASSLTSNFFKYPGYSEPKGDDIRGWCSLWRGETSGTL